MLRQDMRYADVATLIRRRSATAHTPRSALTAQKLQSARPIPRRQRYSTAQPLLFWTREVCARIAGFVTRMGKCGIKSLAATIRIFGLMFLRQVHHCPAGRLVAFDKATGKTIEPDLPVSIGLIEDPVKDCGGPIWLRGGISLRSADGYHYEIRNRVTVCRCSDEDKARPDVSLCRNGAKKEPQASGG
jgi:hypothetical protein